MFLLLSFLNHFFAPFYLQTESSPDLTSALFGLLIIVTVIIGIVLLSVFSIKGRRILWLFFLSQWPMTILAIFVGINASIDKATSSWPVIIIESIIFFALSAVCVFLSYRAVRKYDVIPPFSWKYFRLGRTVVGFSLLIGSQLLIARIVQIFSQNTTTTQNQAALNSIAEQVPYLLFFLTTTLAGFFEELVFRVGAFEILLPKHKKSAFIVSTVTFAAVHSPTDIPSIVIYGTMSLIITGFYYKYRNFYLVMCIHMALNFFISGLYWLS